MTTYHIQRDAITSSEAPQTPAYFFSERRWHNQVKKWPNEQHLMSANQLLELVGDDCFLDFELYGRRKAWEDGLMAEFCESLLIGLPVAPIILCSLSAESDEIIVIDGRQRLTALKQFMDNDLVMQATPMMRGLRAKKREDFAPSIVDDMRVPVNLIGPGLSGNQRLFLMKRMNQGRHSLSTQQCRSLSYRGFLSQVLYNVSGNDFLREKIGTDNELSLSWIQMKGVSFLVKALLAMEGHWQASLEKDADEFYVEYGDCDKHQAAMFSDRLQQAIDIAEHAFPQHAFMKNKKSSVASLSGFVFGMMVADKLVKQAPKTDWHTMSHQTDMPIDDLLTHAGIAKMPTLKNNSAWNDAVDACTDEVLKRISLH